MDIEDILSKHKELVERKFHENNGLVSRETAAFIVAQDMGLKVEEETTPELKISQLAAGMRRVALTGKVLAADPLEEYSKKDGTPGHVQRLVMKDEDDTERVEVVFWDPPNEELKAGQWLKISGGYIKNLGEAVQLNVSDRGSVEILGFEPLRLEEVLDGARGLTVKAAVLHVYPDKLFEAKRGGIFRASSLTLFHDSWKARVIFWEQEAEKPTELQTFQEIELTNLRALVDDSGLLSLTASSATTVLVEGEVEPIQVETFTPHEIDHPELDISIQGVVSSFEKEPERLEIILSDEQAELSLAILHQDAIESLKNIVRGHHISAKCVDVLQTPSGEMEARSTIWSQFFWNNG